MSTNIDVRGGKCGACGGRLVGIKNDQFPLQCLDCGSGRPMAIAMQVSRAEQDHQAAMRARSAQLAVERGHMRRN
ncbi:hypothetical protein [Nocardia nova]